MPENLLCMQLSHIRYANMDFFKTPHIQIQLLGKDPVFKYEFLVLFIYPCLKEQPTLNTNYTLALKALKASFSEVLANLWMKTRSTSSSNKNMSFKFLKARRDASWRRKKRVLLKRSSTKKILSFKSHILDCNGVW